MKTATAKTKKTKKKIETLKQKKTAPKGTPPEIIATKSSEKDDEPGAEMEGILSAFSKSFNLEHILPIGLSTNLLVKLFEKSKRHCSDLLKQIAKASGKTPEQILTINDLCKTNKIDYDEVVFAIYFKEKYLDEFAKNFMEKHRHSEISKLEKEKNAMQEKWKTEYLEKYNAEMREEMKREVRKEIEQEMEEQKSRK